MATDVDGSNLVLAIGGQPDALRMTMHDDYATLCGGGAAILHGTGTVAGASASVTFNVRCVNKTPLPDSPYTFTYDGTTDTLIDGYGLIWSRP